MRSKRYAVQNQGMTLTERDCKRFFYRRFVAKRGPCSQAFLMETVETGDKNRELYANESCDEHAVYFRR